MLLKWHGTKKGVLVTEKRNKGEGKDRETENSGVTAALKSNSSSTKLCMVLYTIEINIKGNFGVQGFDSK